MQHNTQRTAGGVAIDRAFEHTRWSLIAIARDRGAEGARHALGELCHAYSYPAYAYVRRCGHRPEQAYAITAAFFSQLVEALRQDDPAAHGRFRQFLLSRLAHFMAEDWPSGRQAAATGGLHFSQSPLELETRHQRDGVADGTPESSFQRGFALELLGRSRDRLRNEAQRGGRSPMFDLLEPYLHADPPPGVHEQLARLLGIRSLSVVMAIKRLRQRFRELVDEELAETVANAADLQAERDALLNILGAQR